MKKLSTSVSPFVMLIIPVMLLLSMALTFNSDEQLEDNLSTTTLSTSAAQEFASLAKKTAIRFLMER